MTTTGWLLVLIGLLAASAIHGRLRRALRRQHRDFQRRPSQWQRFVAETHRQQRAAERDAPAD